MPQTTRPHGLSLSTVVAAGAVAAMTLGGCSSDSGSSSDAEEPNAQNTTEAVTDAEESAPAAESESGLGAGTITLSDGTVLQLAMETCKTKANAPSSFLVDDGFSLFGRTSDDVRFQAINTGGPEVSGVQALISLEAQFDENGANNAVTYLATDDTLDSLVTNGTQVSGEVDFENFVGSDPIFGEQVTAEIDISCGS